MRRSGDWEAKLLPVMGDELRKRRGDRRRRSAASWYVDETGSRPLVLPVSGHRPQREPSTRC